MKVQKGRTTAWVLYSIQGWGGTGEVKGRNLRDWLNSGSGKGRRVTTYLVLLPELMELVAVYGKLDKVKVIALNAEVQVPKPEYKAAPGWEWGSVGSRNAKAQSRTFWHPPNPLEIPVGGGCQRLQSGKGWRKKRL